MLARLFMLFCTDKVSYITATDPNTTYPFNLFQDAGMEVLVQIAVLERIVGGFLRGGDRCAEVLQLGREAHPYFKRIDHHLASRLFLRVL